jgi:hypothetical protein
MASTPAMTADPASFATSCATRVTRAMGAGTREELLRLLLDFPLAPRALDDLLPLAALRVDVVPRLPVLELALFDAERPGDALREVLRDVLDAPPLAAERPRDFVLFPRFLLPLLDVLLLAFPRDFLALVAIDASPRSH